MLKPLGVMRWDPRTRAGAVAVRPTRNHDMQAVADVTDLVMDWAGYQNLGAHVDNVETSKVRGNYDWRSYLHEETDIARQREAERLKQRAKERPAQPRGPPPAPSSLYA